jgi:hypothetical protein
MRGARTGIRLAAASLLLALAAPSAHAAWSRVTEIPATDVYSLRVQGDTVLAGRDTVLHISPDGGTTWRRSAPVGATPAAVEAAWMHHGRVWAGTYGSGAYSSDDLGATWTDRNAGLAGGLFGSHAYVLDFEEREGRLYAGTGGAGVYVIDLASPTAWSGFFRSDLENAQGGEVLDLARDGAALMTSGGANGELFRNAGPTTGWAEVFLDDTGIIPDLTPFQVATLGDTALAMTEVGMFRRAGAAARWEYVGPSIGRLLAGSVVTEPGRAIAMLQRLGTSYLYTSIDGGATWEPLDSPVTYTYEIAVSPGTLWAARNDGLWRSPLPSLDVAPRPPVRALGLAHAGRHPASDRAALRLSLPRAVRATLDLLDVTGRRVAPARALELPAGEHRIELDLGTQPAGVYVARLTAGGDEASLRLVRLP